MVIMVHMNWDLKSRFHKNFKAVLPIMENQKEIYALYQNEVILYLCHQYEKK